MNTVYVCNQPEAEKLAAVMNEMETAGSPKIRAIWTGDSWIAIEGSHRVAAAHKLGVPVEIIEVDEDDEISDHDFEDCDEIATAAELAEYVGMSGPAYMVEII